MNCLLFKAYFVTFFIPKQPVKFNLGRYYFILCCYDYTELLVLIVTPRRMAMYKAVDTISLLL